MRRMTESKSGVRKCAVQAMEVAIENGYVEVTPDVINTVDLACRDPMLSVRKLAIQCTTSMVSVSCLILKR